MLKHYVIIEKDSDQQKLMKVCNEEMATFTSRRLDSNSKIVEVKSSLGGWLKIKQAMNFKKVSSVLAAR